MKNMKVFITGADGLLGSNVIREMIRRGHTVTALIEEGKSPKTLDGLMIKLVYGNILNAASLSTLMRGMDKVIHCAASTNIWPARSKITRKVNIDGTQNVIDACLENDIERVVFVGTANSFGRGSLDNPGNETNDYKASIYGLDYMDSKRTAQERVLKAVKEHQLPALIVNPTFMIGPNDSKPSSGAMILALIEGKVPCYTNGGKNYINVKDAAIGICNALTMGKIGEAYILGNQNLTFREMFQKIGTVVGAKPSKRTLPSFIVKSYGWLNSTFARLFGFTPSISHEMAILSCEDHYYSAQKAVEHLDLPQTPIENGILDCYEWFLENGYIKQKQTQKNKPEFQGKTIVG